MSISIGGGSSGGPGGGGGASSGDVGTLDQLDLTNANPITVAIVNTEGNQVASFGAGLTNDELRAADVKITLDGETVPVSATDLDTRNLTFATDVVNVSGSTVAVSSVGGTVGIAGVKSHNNVAPGTTNLGVLPALANAAAPVFGEGLQTVLSTDLTGNVRAILAANSGVDVGDVTINNATLAVTQSGTWDEVGINDSGNSITVDATDLDIRNLAFATDKVDVGGSLVTTLPFGQDDWSGFTATETKNYPIGAVFSSDAIDLTNNRYGMVRATAKRGLHVNLRDSSGNEVTTLATREVQASTATLSNVNDTAVSTTLLAANANRLGATIHNDSTAILYVKFGITASTTSYTVKLVADAYYEVPFNYTGRIDGIWASDASGAARITELT